MEILKQVGQVNAAIFDFDGIIVDTEPLHYKAFQVILEPFGISFSWQNYCDTYMGFDDRDAFIEAFSSNGQELLPDRLTGLIRQKAAYFENNVDADITAYPGVVDLVRSLRQAGIPVAISSGALRSDILPILAILQIADCFEIMVTAEDVQKSKPDPESYRLAFQKLSLKFPLKNLMPETTLAIEDTPAGIAAAKGAGLKVLAVTNSYSREHLVEADLIVDSVTGITLI